MAWQQTKPHQHNFLLPPLPPVGTPEVYIAAFKAISISSEKLQQLRTFLSDTLMDYARKHWLNIEWGAKSDKLEKRPFIKSQYLCKAVSLKEPIGPQEEKALLVKLAKLVGEF